MKSFIALLKLSLKYDVNDIMMLEKRTNIINQSITIKIKDKKYNKKVQNAFSNIHFLVFLFFFFFFSSENMVSLSCSYIYDKTK